VSGALAPHLDYIDPLFRAHQAGNLGGINTNTDSSSGSSSLSSSSSSSSSDQEKQQQQQQQLQPVFHADMQQGESAHEHDYDSAAEGTNRYLTLLLYLSDVEAGGETVFTALTPSSTLIEEEVAGADTTSGSSGSKPSISSSSPSSRLDEEKITDKYLRKLHVSGLLEKGTWEYSMMTECRNRLTVKPKKLEAVLYYSQYANGAPNLLTRHGGCPVLKV
jgi:hypothetical protein